MNDKDHVKIVFLTDLHLGHNKVPVSHVYKSLTEHFFPALDKDTDMVILGGDFTDRLLTFDGTPGQFALRIIDRLIDAAHKHDFLLRIMQGTFLHDRDQLDTFTTRAERYREKDVPLPHVKVVKQLSVEYIKEYGMRVLYLPGDLPYSDMLIRAEDAISAQGGKVVDVVVHHGYLDHLVPDGVTMDRTNIHSVHDFRRILDGVLLNGHVHTPSIHQNAINGGSFERLKHGEEEPKGFYVVKLYFSGKQSVEFIENKNAAIFKTIDMTKWGDQDDCAYTEYSAIMSDFMDTVPKGKPVHIRLLTDYVDVRNAVASYSRAMFPDVHLTSARVVKRRNNIPVIDDTCELHVPDINEGNLAEVLYRETGGKVPLDSIKRMLKKGW